MDPLRHNDYTNVGDSTLQNAMNEALEGSASNSFTDPSTEPPYLLDSLAQPFGGGIWSFDELIYEPLIPPTAAAPPTFPQQPQNPAAATSEAAAGGTTTTNNNNAVATFDPSISIHPTINVPFGAMPGDYPPPANWHPLAQDAMPPTPPPTTFDEEYVARYGPPQPQPPRTNVRLLQPSNSTSLRQLSTSSRRKSADETHRRRGSSSRRRNSVQNSVAHQVSLTLHAPTSVYKDGIEWINFLYSHDRIVTEYSIRADIESVNLNQVPDDFKNANTIYPRANVSREEYEGNRWDYETSCNTLGWKLCWLNRDVLVGKRGLLQRAVDSYRNRHHQLKSRRVSRQEKVENGTLRGRRSMSRA
ncbi:hypothetical protein VTP01DRAFT_1098 [Rhizomucor pusillus]|uniref:uncharacterized protein n=1 Tax=Rhizomucor pusillus TaxID=4840 RepID=UPI003743ADED